MPARPIGSGTVSFGLVSIPVKLYSSTESASSVSFNLLHAGCGTRLKQQYVCPKDGEVVPRDRMAKGYEFAKDQYVLFSEDELKEMTLESHKAIEIAEFVPAEKIDPIYFDGAYYLGPDKGGEKAYRLLAEAMRKTSRAALARWINRGRQILVLVRAVAGGLVMQQLHYADEVRAFSEVPVADADVRDAELALGVQLIEQIAASDFRPDRYEDEVKKRILAAIQRKVEGQDVVATAPEPARGQIIDLMEALKASLAARGAGGAEPTPASAERKPPKRSPRAPEPEPGRVERPARAARKASSG